MDDKVPNLDQVIGRLKNFESRKEQQKTWSEENQVNQQDHNNRGKK